MAFIRGDRTGLALSGTSKPDLSTEFLFPSTVVIVPSDSDDRKRSGRIMRRRTLSLISNMRSRARPRDVVRPFSHAFTRWQQKYEQQRIIR